MGQFVTLKKRFKICVAKSRVQKNRTIVVSFLTDEPSHSGLHTRELPCGPAMLSRRKLSGDPLETLRRGSPDFLAKALIIPAIYTKFKLKFVSLNFHTA